jgi:hypothetical protein
MDSFSCGGVFSLGLTCTLSLSLMAQDSHRRLEQQPNIWLLATGSLFKTLKQDTREVYFQLTSEGDSDVWRLNCRVGWLTGGEGRNVVIYPACSATVFLTEPYEHLQGCLDISRVTRAGSAFGSPVSLPRSFPRPNRSLKRQFA